VGTSVALGVAGLLAAALVANAIVTTARTERADASAPGRLVGLPGQDLHVIDEGPRDDAALVLIHGYAGSVNWWERAARILARKRRVIRLDLLGHGASEKPRRGYAMAEQGRRVVNVVRKLGVKRIVVVGHSMGGHVAVATAERDRDLVRGVVVIGTPSEARFAEGPGLLRLVFAPVLGQAVYRFAPDSAIKSRLRYTAFAGGVEFPDRWVEDFRDVTYTAFTRSGLESREYLVARPDDLRMAGTRRPLLVLFGRKDRAVNPAAALRWDVPGVQVVRWAGVGHTPQHERPRQTAALILRFASSVLGGSR
jgi:pimeloyl-ACP methyl ester carboxylesterase